MRDFCFRIKNFESYGVNFIFNHIIIYLQNEECEMFYIFFLNSARFIHRKSKLQANLPTKVDFTVSPFTVNQCLGDSHVFHRTSE